MSIADVQATVILSIATASVITIAENDMAGDAGPVILYAAEAWKGSVAAWPETGNWVKNTRKAAVICKDLTATLEGAADLGPCLLIMLAQAVLINLRDKIKSPVKIGILDELLESVNSALDIFDPDEKDLTSRAEADRLCGLINKRIRA